MVQVIENTLLLPKVKLDYQNDLLVQFRHELLQEIADRLTAQQLAEEVNRALHLQVVHLDCVPVGVAEAGFFLRLLRNDGKLRVFGLQLFQKLRRVNARVGYHDFFPDVADVNDFPLKSVVDPEIDLHAFALAKWDQISNLDQIQVFQQFDDCSIVLLGQLVCYNSHQLFHLRPVQQNVLHKRKVNRFLLLLLDALYHSFQLQQATLQQ